MWLPHCFCSLSEPYLRQARVSRPRRPGCSNCYSSPLIANRPQLVVTPAVIVVTAVMAMLASTASASTTIYTSASVANFSWTNKGTGEPILGASTAPTTNQDPSEGGRSSVFLAEPRNVYYIRATRPASVMCRAYAVDLEVVCAGESMNRQSVRKQLQPLPGSAEAQPGRTAAGGSRLIIQVEVNVTLQMVRDYFDAYHCECVAYLDGGRQRRVSSVSGQMVLAYLDKSFRREPLSTYVEILQQVELPCMAPEGVPPPTISWQKNGRDILAGVNSNYILTHDGSLIINQVRLFDEANYTCVARNELGMQKQTDPATLYVNVHGGWTAWSSWTACNSPCSAAGGQQEQHRRRECKSPAPRNHGRPCDGPSVQVARCGESCGGGDGIGSGGSWEAWSAWSACDPATCQRLRTRSCTSSGGSSPSLQPQSQPRLQDGEATGSTRSSGPSCTGGGSDRESSNCTEPCAVQSLPQAPAEDREAMENIILYVSLCGAVALLAVILIVVVLCVMKRLNRRQARDSQAAVVNGGAASRSGSYSPGSEKAHQSASGSAGRAEPSKTVIAMEMPRPVASWQEPGSSPTERAPMLPRSTNGGYYYASNVCQGGAASAAPVLPPPLPPPLPPRPGHMQAPAADECSASLSSGRGSSGIGDAYDGSSTASASERLLSNVDAEALCWSEVTHVGARLTLTGSGISLLIPEGALARGSHEEAFVASLREDKDRPPLLEKQTLLSPVLMCGPQQAALQRTPVLTFDHCANLKSGQWKLSLYSSSSPYDAEAPAWERLLTLNPEQSLPSSSAVYCHLDAGQCHVMLTRLASRYCLVGESSYGGKALKQLKLVAFTRPLLPQQQSTCTAASIRSHAGRSLAVEHSVRVYVLPDTRDAVQSVIHAETGLGAKMIDKPKQLPFQDGSGGLCLAVDSLAPGWTCKAPTAHQEIQFSHIWSGNQNFPSCAFVFECLHDVPQTTLSCKIQAYQKSLPVGRQTLHILCRSEATLKRQGHGGHKGSVAAVSAASSSSGCSSIVTLDGLQGQQSQQQSQQMLPALRLSPQLRAKLCELLDPAQRHCADWRMLCAAMGAEKHLGFFASRPSPTEAVLHLWEALRNEDTPISDLTGMLRSIGRDDAASLIEREFRGTPWV